jgi:hypothetical protein
MQLLIQDRDHPSDLDFKNFIKATKIAYPVDCTRNNLDGNNKFILDMRVADFQRDSESTDLPRGGRMAC